MDWMCPQVNSCSSSQLSATDTSLTSFFSASNKSSTPVSPDSTLVNDFECPNSLKSEELRDDTFKEDTHINNQEEKNTVSTEVDLISAIKKSECRSYIENKLPPPGIECSRPNLNLKESSSKSNIKQGYGIFSSKAERSCDTNFKVNESVTQNDISENESYGNYVFNYDSLKTGTPEYKTMCDRLSEVKPLCEVKQIIPNTFNEYLNVPASNVNPNYHRNLSLPYGPRTAPNIYSRRGLPKEPAPTDHWKPSVSKSSDVLSETKNMKLCNDFCDNTPKQTVKLPYYNYNKNSSKENKDFTNHFAVPQRTASPDTECRFNMKQTTLDKYKCSKNNSWRIDIPQEPSRELEHSRPPFINHEHCFLPVTNHPTNHLMTKSQQRQSIECSSSPPMDLTCEHRTPAAAYKPLSHHCLQRQRIECSGSPPMDLTYCDHRTAAAAYKPLSHHTSVANLQVFSVQILQMNYQNKDRPSTSTNRITENHSTATAQPVRKRRKLDLKNIF